MLDLVNNIKGRYSFDEVPQQSIILRNASGNHVSLSANNFVGHLESYVMLARVTGKEGTTIEWVKENAKVITKGGFPTPPGIYYLKVTAVTEGVGGEFTVEPVIDVYDERVILNGTVGVLNDPFLPNTLRLIELPGNIQYKEGVHYTADPETGEINLTEPLPAGTSLSADYRYAGDLLGPFKLIPNHTAPPVLPGVIIAFGNRYQLGDEMAIVVTRERMLTAEIYGGKWDISLDFEVTGRSIEEMEEILDFSVMYLQGVARSRLSTEGIEMGDISMGGETEDLVATGETEDFYYRGSFSASFMTDWEIHKPLPALIRRIIPILVEDLSAFDNLPDDQIHKVQSSLRMLESNNLTVFSDPFYTIQKTSMERIV